MRYILFFVAVFLCNQISAQQQSQQAALDSIENRYHQCLANSQRMYDCAAVYYHDVDSLLRGTLQQLYSSLDPVQLSKLQQDQTSWEERKDAFFRKIDERVEKMHKRTMDGLDDDMISTDNKAAFIKDRVISLFGYLVI
ncbi:lysozyme inhibitor LprI family protein [Chitinophaga vietnamensis]|uniref:lysozyme inhibitor LprI family protein n=1 Tax=Chitinophaga vietnamensis TaxID=2593957 RepID=UPI001177BC86|nr:lysozyme inhibitor LprI family protein [Chitinophaga vietnamensis]